MEFLKNAFPDNWVVEGPHRVARNFCQKFRQQLQKFDFFVGKNAKIDVFEGSIWKVEGCAWSEIVFCGDPHWLGVKPHGGPKRHPRPPQPSRAQF